MEDFNMNRYETVIILDTEISEQTRKNVIAKIVNYISENGKITEEKDLRERTLAYEINGHKKGYYYSFDFEATANSIPELERIYRITDEILKFIVIRRIN